MLIHIFVYVLDIAGQTAEPIFREPMGAWVWHNVNKFGFFFSKFDFFLVFFKFHGQRPGNSDSIKIKSGANVFEQYC